MNNSYTLYPIPINVLILFNLQNYLRMKKRLVSRREIGIEIFELENKNALVVARLLDTIHLISLDLEVNPNTRVIVDARCEMPNSPYKICPNVCDKAKELIGVAIQKGIMKEIAIRIGGSDGCIHLRELASEAANFCATALIGYKEGFGLTSPDFNKLSEEERFNLTKELLKGTCYPYTYRGNI